MHAAVINNMLAGGKDWTGCTVHKLRPKLTRGLSSTETLPSATGRHTGNLKTQRVQQLEGIALIEVVSYYHKTAGTDPSWGGLAEQHTSRHSTRAHHGFGQNRRGGIRCRAAPLGVEIISTGGTAAYWNELESPPVR